MICIRKYTKNHIFIFGSHIMDGFNNMCYCFTFKLRPWAYVYRCHALLFKFGGFPKYRLYHNPYSFYTIGNHYISYFVTEKPPLMKNNCTSLVAL